MKSFMNPYIEKHSSGSSMNQSIENYQKDSDLELRDLQLALGKLPYKGGGRTLNIPKYLPENIIPGPSFNNGHTIGAPCLGSHCGISIAPTSHNYSNNIIPQIPDTPPNISSQIIGNNRLGNNSFSSNLIRNYSGTKLNPGPFNIQCAGSHNPFKYITHPLTRKKYSIKSRKGQKLLNNFLDKIKW